MSVGDQRRVTHLNFGWTQFYVILVKHISKSANWNYERMQYWDGIVNALYSAAHEQLDSPRVSRATRTRVLEHAHASTRTRTRVYSREYTRVLENARAHARTRARDSRAVDTLASYPSPPLSFRVGEARV